MSYYRVAVMVILLWVPLSMVMVNLHWVTASMVMVSLH